MTMYIACYTTFAGEVNYLVDLRVPVTRLDSIQPKVSGKRGKKGRRTSEMNLEESLL